MTEDPEIIVNEFNNFFCSIGSDLAEKILKKTNKQSYEYLTNKISSLIYLEPPTSNQILNLILSLNDNKALGHDNISAYFLKVSRYESLNILNILQILFLIMECSLAIAK